VSASDCDFPPSRKRRGRSAVRRPRSGLTPAGRRVIGRPPSAARRRVCV
jgi:hypothetical protein